MRLPLSASDSHSVSVLAKKLSFQVLIHLVSSQLSMSFNPLSSYLLKHTVSFLATRYRVTEVIEAFLCFCAVIA